MVNEVKQGKKGLSYILIHSHTTTALGRLPIGMALAT